MNLLIVSIILNFVISVKNSELNCSSFNVQSYYNFQNHTNLFEPTSIDSLSNSCPCEVKPCINLCCSEIENCIFEKVKTRLDGIDVYFYGNSCENDQINQTLIKRIRVKNKDLLVYFSKYGRDKKKRARMPKCDSEQKEVIKNCQAMVPDDKNLGFYKTPFPIILISLGLLIVLLLIYLCNPKLQNIHEKALMCHIFSTIISYIIFIIRWGYAIDLINLGPKARIIFGILLYYTDLSSIFWINIMCYDIWWGIRSLKAANINDNWSFVYYSLYARGVPFLVTIFGTGYITMIYGKEAGLSDPLLEIEPQIFYHASIGLVITLNVIFFICTSVYIYRTHKGIVSANRRTKVFNRVYIRLMIIMIPECRYILLIILYYSGILKSVTAAYIQSYFYVLHGLVTFLVYASSTKIRNIILNRILCKRSEYSISSQDAKL